MRLLHDISAMREVTDARGFGWHVTADLRKDHNQRRLAHVGGLTTHVRPGDNEQAIRIAE